MAADQARTEVIFIEGINQQLAATMRAALPPTQQLVSDQAIVTPGMNAPLPDQFTATPNFAGDQPIDGSNTNQLTEVGVALDVRQSDDCAVSVQTQVPSSAERIYATTRILNAASGTQVGAIWNYAGETVFTNSSYTIPRDDEDFCLWFYIEPSDTPFSPGDWSIQFLVNGVPQLLVSFMITN